MFDEHHNSINPEIKVNNAKIKWWFTFLWIRSFRRLIKNDYSYFYSNNDGRIVPDRSKYDKLSQIEVKKLKLYYSTYKNKETEEDKKTQSQKDYEELLKLGNEDQNLRSYLDGYLKGLTIAGISVTSAFTIIMFVFFAKSIKDVIVEDWDDLTKAQWRAFVETFATLIASAIFAVLIFYSTTW